jgi:CRISPR-associated protein Cmr1
VELRIETLTPLWTGGVETGRMDRIHETSILGSLRWWYEAIMRGLGGNPCDPTSEGPNADRCPQKTDGQEEFCTVCQLFGATGCRRKFRLRMRNGEALFNNNARNILLPSGRIHTRPQLRAGGWYLMGDSVMGNAIPLRLIPLATADVLSPLSLILSLIDRHAAIGAKVSNGYGVVRFYENGQSIQVHMLEHFPDSSQPPPRHTLPDIRDFFFARFQFQEPQGNSSWWQNIQGIVQSWNGLVIENQNQVYVHRNQQEQQQVRHNLERVVQDGLLALAPAVRNWLRYHWKSGMNDCQKYYLFGEARPVCPYCCQAGYREDKNDHRRNWCPNCKNTFAKGAELPDAASKVNVSNAYRLDNGDWEFRVWGWIPCQPPNGIHLNRDQFLDDLQTTLTNAATWQWVFGASSPALRLVEWHALDCMQHDGTAYLRELLDLNQGGTT